MYCNKGFIYGAAFGLGSYSAVSYFVGGNYLWFGLSILILLTLYLFHYSNSKEEKGVRAIGSMYVLLAQRATQFIGEKEHMDEFASFMHKKGLTLQKVDLDEV